MNGGHQLTVAALEYEGIGGCSVGMNSTGKDPQRGGGQMGRGRYLQSQNALAGGWDFLFLKKPVKSRSRLTLKINSHDLVGSIQREKFGLWGGRISSLFFLLLFFDHFQEILFMPRFAGFPLWEGSKVNRRRYPPVACQRATIPPTPGPGVGRTDHFLTGSARCDWSSQTINCIDQRELLEGGRRRFSDHDSRLPRNRACSMSSTLAGDLTWGGCRVGGRSLMFGRSHLQIAAKRRAKR